MHHLTETFVADRTRRIEEEAATERLAKLIATDRTRPAWRRYVGNGARLLAVSRAEGWRSSVRWLSARAAITAILADTAATTSIAANRRCRAPWRGDSGPTSRL